MDSIRIAQIREALYEVGATLEGLYALGRTLNIETAYRLAVLTWDLDQGITDVIYQIDDAELFERLDKFLEDLQAMKIKPPAAPIVMHRDRYSNPHARLPTRHRRHCVPCRRGTPT